MTYFWLNKANTTYRNLLIGQAAFSLIIGFLTDSLLLGAVGSLLIIALPLALFRVAQHATYTRHVAVIASQLLAALHIQQSGGLTYMHFEIFAVMAVTMVYRDWRLLISSVVVVAAHHVGAFALQTSGINTIVAFEDIYLNIYVLAIHAFFAVAEGVIVGIMCHQAFQDAMVSQKLRDSINTIMSENGEFNLNIKADDNSNTIREFNSLINAFSTIIGQTKEVAKEISDTSETVNVLASGVKQASEDTTKQVTTIASATEEMTANNDTVLQRATEVTDLSKQAQSSSNEAKTIIVESNTEVLSLQDDLQQTSSAITKLSEKCQQIESVMAAITAISEQTNLLALNAAIESARAGEHGRGFAVVADEVRQLAMRTKDNTSQIADITSQLIQESNMSVEKMQVCVEKSTKVSDSSESAKNIIDQVFSHINSVSENMESVNHAIADQARASTQIAESTGSLSGTSEGLSTNADKTEQNFNMLKSEIDRLELSLSKFK